VNLLSLNENWGSGAIPEHPATGKYYVRYLAQIRRQLHNAAMGLDLLLIGFLQRIAVGAGTVFALLLITRFGLPRRSAIVSGRRIVR
jgi:hypothetical protein